MKKPVATAIILFLLICTKISATIINIPADYPTIQGGIDASSDGDTILVETDTYYENIRIDGKKVQISSRFLIEKDSSFISNTIINGNRTKSVVSFSVCEDSGTSLTGFTITGGYARSGGGYIAMPPHQRSQIWY